MENSHSFKGEGKNDSESIIIEEQCIQFERDGYSPMSDHIAEFSISETESERRQTDTLTKQLSATRINDDTNYLFKGLSHMLSADGSDMNSFNPNPSFYQELNGIHIENMNNSDRSLIRQQSALLLEMKKNLSFSRNPSSSMGHAPGFLTFSRNSSLEGYLYPNDLLFQRSPSMLLNPDSGLQSDPANRDFNVLPADFHRNDSLKLETLQLMDLKRHSNSMGLYGDSINTKLLRQNTQTSFPSMYSPSTHPLSPVKPNQERDSHRLLTAKINGVLYQSELKKKDKKDPQKWSKEEDELLRLAVKEFGEKQWKDIAQRIPGRNHVQCLQRWKKVLKPGLKKGHWTEEEDNLLRAWKDKLNNWAEVAEKIPGRTAKQCRERWCNHVDPSIRKGDWTEAEDKLIISLQKEWGNRWSSIANNLPGRSENAVKIRWKTLCKHGFHDLHPHPINQVLPLGQSVAQLPSRQSINPIPSNQSVAQLPPGQSINHIPVVIQQVPRVEQEGYVLPSYIGIQPIPLNSQQSYPYGTQDIPLFTPLVQDGHFYQQHQNSSIEPMYQYGNSLNSIPHINTTLGNETELPSLG